MYEVVSVVNESQGRLQDFRKGVGVGVTVKY